MYSQLTEGYILYIVYACTYTTDRSLLIHVGTGIGMQLLLLLLLLLLLGSSDYSELRVAATTVFFASRLSVQEL